MVSNRNDVIKMNRKLIPFIITLLMVIGSFGAIGTENTDNANYCGCNPSSSFTTSDDGDYYLGMDESLFQNGDVDPCKPRFNPNDVSSFDWRDADKNPEGRNCVTPVRNQGQCGSCWAFATVAPVESKIMIQHKTNFDISERWLVSNCCDAGDCNGGWWAFDWYKKDKTNCGDFGTVSESDLPYSESYGHGEACNCDLSFHYSIDNWAYVEKKSGVASTKNIKQAIMDHGPVAVAVYVDSDFQAYKSGVFKETYSGGSINHGVTLVGWDDNKGNGCWILKNSWGTGWGENGYMYIEYGANNIGYASAYVGNVIPKTPPESGKPRITIDIDKVGCIDDIDVGIWPATIEPEWYYILTVTESNGNTHTVRRENKDSSYDWISENEWVLSSDLDANNNKKHRYVFDVDSETVDISVKLMDADELNELFCDDVADISDAPDPYYKNGDYDNIILPGKRDVEDYTAYKVTYNIRTQSSLSPKSYGTDDGSHNVDENDAYIYFNEISDNYESPSVEIDSNPTKAVKNVERTFKGKLLSGSHGPFEYQWDFSYDENEGFNVDATGESIDKKWSSTGTYTVALRIKDDLGWYSDISTADIKVEENQKPSAPSVSGPSSGKVEPGSHDFTFKSTDPNGEGDKVYYRYKLLIEKKIGDDETVRTSDWAGPYKPGAEQTFSINLAEKNTDYIVRAQSKDLSGAESDWSSDYRQPTPKLKDKNIFIEPLIRQLLKLFVSGYSIFESLLTIL